MSNTYPMYEALEEMLHEYSPATAIGASALLLKRSDDAFQARLARQKSFTENCESVPIGPNDMEEFEVFLLKLMDMDDAVVREYECYKTNSSDQSEGRLLAALKAATEVRA